jgi:hypothetical protein
MKGRTINPDKKIGTALTLSRETIEIIDRERGQSSRSSFVDNWILAANREAKLRGKSRS